MGNVTVNSISYPVYNDDVAAVKEYLRSGVNPGKTAFLALTTDDDRAARIIAARRMLDRQSWAGAKTVSSQALAFPRTGLTDRDGEAVDDSTVPQQVKDAEAELAGILTADESVAGAANNGSNIQQLVAGPVSVTYHQATNTPEAGATKLPSVVMDLIGPFLGGAEADDAPIAYGFSRDNVSSFDDCAQYKRSGPLV